MRAKDNEVFLTIRSIKEKLQLPPRGLVQLHLLIRSQEIQNEGTKSWKECVQIVKKKLEKEGNTKLLETLTAHTKKSFSQ